MPTAHAYQVVAAVLHLGNVTFVEPEGQHDASVVPPGSTAEEHMRTACGLLGVEEQELHAVMTTRRLHTSEGVGAEVWRCESVGYGVEEQQVHAMMTTRRLHTSEGVGTEVWRCGSVDCGMGCGGYPLLPHVLWYPTHLPLLPPLCLPPTPVPPPQRSDHRTLESARSAREPQCSCQGVVRSPV